MNILTRSNVMTATGLMALGLTLFGGIESRAAEPSRMTMVGSWPPKVSSAADMGIKFMETVNELALRRLHPAGPAP